MLSVSHIGSVCVGRWILKNWIFAQMWYKYYFGYMSSSVGYEELIYSLRVINDRKYFEIEINIYNIKILRKNIYVFQCMWQLNGKIKQKGVNPLFWMQLNEDGDSGIINYIP